jgi:hypothetical protein
MMTGRFIPARYRAWIRLRFAKRVVVTIFMYGTFVLPLIIARAIVVGPCVANLREVSPVLLAIR